MKKIKLPFGLTALIDNEDYEDVSSIKWSVTKNKRSNLVYAIGWQKKPIRKRVLMHRYIMRTPNDLVCDHISKNTLDNRKSNLRNCTKTQSQANRKKPKNNKSGYKGVYWHLEKKKYVARLYMNKKTVFRKYFDDPKDAKKAYDQAAKKYYGEYRKKDA